MYLKELNMPQLRLLLICGQETELRHIKTKYKILKNILNMGQETELRHIKTKIKKNRSMRTQIYSMKRYIQQYEDTLYSSMTHIYIVVWTHCVRILLCMCPHTTIHVSSYYYICVLMLLYIPLSHTTIYTAFKDTYSSKARVCVILTAPEYILLYMCVLI